MTDQADKKIGKPSNKFLVQLAKALSDAKHKDVAEHVAAGLLWSMYPEWFKTEYLPFVGQK